MKGLHCSGNANFVNSVDEISNFISQFLSVPSVMKIRYLYATLKHKDSFVPNSMGLTVPNFHSTAILSTFLSLKGLCKFQSYI